MKVVQLDSFAPRAKEAQEHGFTFTCAMCFHLHRAYAQVNSWGKVQCRQACGGPGSGRNYPLYEGPLGQNLMAHCVYCGKKDPENAVTVRSDPNRILGICKEHLDRLEKTWSIRSADRESPVFRADLHRPKVDILG